MKQHRQIKLPEVARLQEAFLALRPLVRGGLPRAPKQTYHLKKLESAFGELRTGLSQARDEGGLVNPWSIAGLKRDEVRNAAALAGIWLPEFGGAASRRFLANVLNAALPSEEWSEELAEGYRIETEFSPIGDISDRVDLVIESQNHLVGIEVKIDATLGHQQLERYSASMDRRASITGKQSHVFLLAPFASPNSKTPSITWREISRSARASVEGRLRHRSFAEHLIVSFGDHVHAF